MPSIGERRLAVLAEGSPQSISIRLTNLQPAFCCGCLPRAARLHLSHQSDFGHMT